MSKPYERLRDCALAHGWVYLKPAAGDHEKWKHRSTGKITTIPYSRKRHPQAVANIMATLKREQRLAEVRREK